MNSTALTHPPQVSEPPSLRDEVPEFLPWVAAAVVLGPITLLSLMLWAPFLLVLTLAVAPFLVACVLGVVAATLASPFLLARHLQERAAERRRSRQPSRAMPRAIATVGSPR